MKISLVILSLLVSIAYSTAQQRNHTIYLQPFEAGSDAVTTVRATSTPSGSNRIYSWRQPDGVYSSDSFSSDLDFENHVRWHYRFKNPNHRDRKPQKKLASSNPRLNAIKARLAAGKLSKRELKLYQKVQLYETIENATRTAMLRNPRASTKAKHRQALKDLERAIDKLF